MQRMIAEDMKLSIELVSYPLCESLLQLLPEEGLPDFQAPLTRPLSERQALWWHNALQSIQL